MLRSILKWRISEAIDRGAALPPAVRRRVANDPELAAYEAAAGDLCQRLRAEAPAWVERHVDDPAVAAARRLAPMHERVPRTAASARRTAARRWGVPLALAASALVALALWESTGDRPYRRLGEADRQRIVAALQSGRANLAQVATVIKRFDADVEWPALPRPAGLASGQRARASAERMLTAFDDGLKEQQHELAASARSAYAFFAVRLPASMATLVGLQEG